MLPTLKEHKKTLILDLDETLIHCNESISKRGDAIIEINIKPKEFIKVIYLNNYYTKINLINNKLLIII